MTDAPGKKGNPNPVQTEDFKQKRFRLEDNEQYEFSLGKENQTCRIPLDYQMALRMLDQKKRTPFRRRALMLLIETELEEYLEAAREELRGQ